jgi:uncharacterized protein (TIGR03435 family)
MMKKILSIGVCALFFCETAARCLGSVAAGTLMLSIGAIAMVSLYAAPQEQATRARPEFEVASIKLNKNSSNPFAMRFHLLPGGRLVAENAPVRFLIMTAYDIAPSRISGGPSFGSQVDRYDIEAKAAEGYGSGRPTREMLQTLLETRFGLKFHWVIEQREVYELTVNKEGPRIKHTQEGSCVPAPASFMPAGPTPGEEGLGFCGLRPTAHDGLKERLEMIGVTMTEFARILSTTTPLHNVVDRTGLNGTFDVSLQWAISLRGGPSGPTDPDTVSTAPDITGPSIFTAVREQLGLKLDRATGPVRVMVVDNLEKPSEN